MRDFFIPALIIGTVGTALLDLWNILLNRVMGFPLPNWAMVGRWFLHLPKGKFAHDGIADSPELPNELRAGWIGHYLIGILFAAALLLIWPGWAKAPTLLPALIVGWVTVGCGWFILSPGLGNGIAGSERPNALRGRILNIVGHTVFGLGMWGAARLLLM